MKTTPLLAVGPNKSPEMDIEKLIENAQIQANSILASTKGIRAEFEYGHPNSSTEATAEGAIRAMATWMAIDKKVRAGN